MTRTSRVSLLLLFSLVLLLGAHDVLANPLDETCDATCLANAIDWLEIKEEQGAKKCKQKCKRNAWSKANDCRGKCCKKICKQDVGEEQEACEKAGFCPDPTEAPTAATSETPSQTHSKAPSLEPSLGQSQSPSQTPSQTPSAALSSEPSLLQSQSPSKALSSEPSLGQSQSPSEAPSQSPTAVLSLEPSPREIPLVTTSPSVKPSSEPSFGPSAEPSALCDESVCDVTEFPGTDDEKIAAALAAALQTSHKTLYFPNGSYRITKSILINVPVVDLVIRGESVDGVVLVSDPIVTSSNCFGSMINIDRAGGFASLFLKIEKLTLDFSANHEHPIFLEAGCSGSGHGVRVGNGWDTGSLHLNELVILKAPGYGIGIQNSGTNDKDADHVLLTKIRVQDAGMDGLDTKQSPTGGNSHLTIVDMTVREIGFNDERSAAALDISYDDFHLERITIVTDAYRDNPKGAAQNTGIRIRERTGNSASHGTIRDLFTKGCVHPVFFAGKTPNRNENVSLTNFILKDFAGTGIYIRGEDHTFSDGCVYGGSGPNARSWYINGADSDPSTIEIVNVFTSGGDPRCPSHASVGSNF